MSMARKELGISCFQALLFLIEVVLPGLSAYALATVLLSDVTHCGCLYSLVDVPSAGVSSRLARLLFSEAFLLVTVHAVLTQIHTTMFVISFATLRRVGLFRARARAILAGLRKRRTVPTSFFHAVAIVVNYFVVLRPAFLELDDRGELELPLMLLVGGTIYLAGMVCNAVSCRLDCAVPEPDNVDHASDSVIGAMRRRLGEGKFWAQAAAHALVGGIVSLPTAMAFPSGHVLAVVAMQSTVVVVIMVAQPVVYQFLWDGYHSL